MANWSTKAEYHALANCTAKLVWFQSLLCELSVDIIKPPILWCDNISVTYLSVNPIFTPVLSI